MRTRQEVFRMKKKKIPNGEEVEEKNNIEWGDRVE